METETLDAVLTALKEDEAALGGASPGRFCFVGGTHIATLRGEMPVETLRVGEYIRAKKGSFHTVTDVMDLTVADVDEEWHSELGLYQLRRGSVDERIPKRDFYVTEGQQFYMTQRLMIAHALRMTTRKSGKSLEDVHYILFRCDGLPMVRAEGLWTTATPIERFFPPFESDYDTWDETYDDGDDLPPGTRQAAER